LARAAILTSSLQKLTPRTLAQVATRALLDGPTLAQLDKATAAIKQLQDEAADEVLKASSGWKPTDMGRELRALADLMQHLREQAQRHPVSEQVEWHAQELAKRFERLITLSMLGSLAFAVGVVALEGLLSWPLAVKNVGVGFAETTTPVVALFSLYLTAVLASAYFPVAAILAARADSLVPLDVVERQDWLAKRGLTATTGTRLLASIATLLPLIAGAVTSAATASSSLGGLLR
jgi:hypothetical protein